MVEPAGILGQEELRPKIYAELASCLRVNGGQPGVEQPHAHVVLYHDAEAKSRLTE
jgi:hypothetical protein